MDFETTTCIACDHLSLLRYFSDKYEISLRTFISLLINYSAKYEKNDIQAFKRIAYRNRKGKNSWKRVHLMLKHSEYEFFLDVKKLWKMSLAKIIEYCIENVLDEFLTVLDERLKNYTDNYREYYEINSYTFDFYKVKGIHCCKFYWGPPPMLLKKAVVC
jgi:hypothetical protein